MSEADRCPTRLADRLVAFALDTRFDQDLPKAVVVEARRRLVDALGCRCSGHSTSRHPRSMLERVAGQFQGTPSVGLVGGGTSTPDWAAFANGVHIRYLDCNDTYLSLEPAHPSDNWAAVMAAGEVAGADGKAWIAAAAVAYEVQCRLCDAASIRARGWDHTTYGSLSSALAAARLLGLSHDQTLHALGIAGTTGTALRLTRAGELSMWKGCAFAFAARNGLFATLLAADGLTGPAPLFEGEMGFFQQVSGPFSIGPVLGETLRRATGMLPEDLDQVRAGRISQPVRHRRRFRVEAEDQRPRGHPVHRNRHVPRCRRDHRQGPREMAAQDARDRRPQPSVLHGRGPGRRRDHGKAVQPRAAFGSGADRPGFANHGRRRSAAYSRLSRGHSQPGDRDAWSDGTTLVEEVAFPPGHDKNPAHRIFEAPFPPTSSTAWSTRCSVTSGRRR